MRLIVGLLVSLFVGFSVSPTIAAEETRYVFRGPAAEATFVRALECVRVDVHVFAADGVERSRRYVGSFAVLELIYTDTCNKVLLGVLQGTKELAPGDFQSDRKSRWALLNTAFRIQLSPVAWADIPVRVQWVGKKKEDFDHAHTHYANLGFAIDTTYGDARSAVATGSVGFPGEDWLEGVPSSIWALVGEGGYGNFTRD